VAEVYLASSALIRDGFDGLRTIEEAQRSGFDGVQLFLDPGYRRDEYLSRVIQELAYSQLGLVIHLPNIMAPEDLAPAEELVSQFPASKLLIHYLPTTELPSIRGTKVGWENSVIGYDLDHIAKTRSAVARDDTFFVFDMGRPLVLENKVKPNIAVHRIREEIQALRPHVDLIHTADKDDWNTRFKGHWRPLGKGVCLALLGEMRAFQGIVVLEHEDLKMAVDSLRVLK